MPLTRSALKLAKENNDVEFVAEFESYAFVDLTKLERRKASKKTPFIKQEPIEPQRNVVSKPVPMEEEINQPTAVNDSISKADCDDAVFRVNEIVEEDRDEVPMEIDVNESEAAMNEPVAEHNHDEFNLDIQFRVTEIIEESGEEQPMSEGEDNEEIPSATTLHRRGSKDSGIESPPVLPDDEEHNSDVIDEDDLLLAPNEDPNDLKDGCTLASPEVPEEQGEVEEIRTPADEIDDVKTEPVDDEEYLRQIDAVKKLERKVVS